ncbi:YhcH/YjgK/YiaL family protein [Elusimicrobium posterum]|uniref:YhcH/YjgK/YiaL family protein n=1 Tax=Elusimicrobium posterum TaxID=3116653 RepID=UPI003C75AA49
MKKLVVLLTAAVMLGACATGGVKKSNTESDALMVNKPLQEIFKMSPVFDKVRDFVAKFDENTPDGRYEIDGDKIFAMVSRYNTKKIEDVLMESHRYHSEIHYLLSGREYLGYTSIEGLSRNTEYDEKSDVEFWNNPPKFDLAYADDKMAVFYNSNAGHAPKIDVDNKERPVVKVVIKFRKEVIDNLK